MAGADRVDETCGWTRYYILRGLVEADKRHDMVSYALSWGWRVGPGMKDRYVMP